MTTAEKLARLKFYGTRYEVAAISSTGRRILVVYTANKSLVRLWGTLQQRGQYLIALCDVAPNQLLVYNRGTKQFELGDWIIKMTGRTQREAIIEGELPFIADVIGSEVTA